MQLPNEPGVLLVYCQAASLTLLLSQSFLLCVLGSYILSVSVMVLERNTQIDVETHVKDRGQRIGIRIEIETER